LHTELTGVEHAAFESAYYSGRTRPKAL
jgi:hypothetical protein